MGGRDASSAVSGMRVLSLENYLASKGVLFPVSDWTLDKTKLPHGETARQREKRLKEGARVAATYYEKRAAARREYEALVAAGKVRPPTKIEETLRTAHGHPDNASVQAARRVLAKRGIDWHTGKEL